jgi:hypothetical protein
MVAVRLGGRALPLAWRVKHTHGAIGFAEQRGALRAAARLLPAGTSSRLRKRIEHAGVTVVLLLKFRQVLGHTEADRVGIDPAPRLRNSCRWRKQHRGPKRGRREGECC